MSSREDRLDRLVGGWWIDRDPVDVARSTIAFVDRIRGLDPLLAEWVIPTGTRASSLRNRFSTDRTPEDVAAAAMWDPDVDGYAPIFMFGAWNGRDGWSSASVDVKGVLRLPGDTIPAKAFLDLPDSVPKRSVEDAFRALVETLRPDIAGLASPATQNELWVDRASGPLLYLSVDRYAKPPALPGFSVVEVGAQGWLLEADAWDLTMAAADRNDAIERSNQAIVRAGPGEA